MGIPRQLILVAPLVASGCGSSHSLAGSRVGAYDTGYVPGTLAGTATTTPPPEVEDDFLALAPAQTDRYVFIANPGRDTLSRVEVDTLATVTVPVGADPQLVQTTADTVVVFNRADDSVSILDADTLDATVVGVRDDLNQMRLSPDGRFAVLWHDLQAERPDDPPPDGLQSFNEASFVDLQTGTHSGMAVGYNPREVVFTPDGTLALIVSDAVLALVDLQAQTLLPELIVLSSELDPPAAEEVVLAPDGSYAFVRQFGATDVLVVDLSLRSVTPIPVGDNPTDLDLTPDGKNAVAVARASEELWVLDAVDPSQPPTVLPLPTGLSLGSIAFDPTADRAVLYTTASPIDRYVVWDMAAGTFQERGLVKQVSGVAMTPVGGSALFFHPTDNPPGMDPADPFYGEHALTMVRLSDGLSNPLLLPDEVVGYALSDDGRHAHFGMVGQRFLETLDFQTLLHTQVALDSVPVHIGSMPDPDVEDGVASKAWVSQDHELGRISFYDLETGDLQTITGFELNSGIERD